MSAGFARNVTVTKINSPDSWNACDGMRPPNSDACDDACDDAYDDAYDDGADASSNCSSATTSPWRRL